MAFSVAASPVQDNRPNRWLVVQPVPTNFIEHFLRPPMAVWRGIGLDASLGNGASRRCWYRSTSNMLSRLGEKKTLIVE